MKNPIYTIAMCNFNMGETLENSLRSILNQLSDNFEVLVVDDGSEDNSLETLKKLEKEYNILRHISLERDESRKLGKTRNISIKESKGEYVLVQLDADDYYECCIKDFVEIFHELEKNFGSDFYLKGNNINMAKSEFLLEIGPYRNLEVGGEDKDLWRRLLAKDKVIWLKHHKFSKPLRKDRTTHKKMKRNISVKTADFQCGMKFWSCISYSIKNIHRRPTISAFDLISFPIAYLNSLGKQKYITPKNFIVEGKLQEEIKKKSKTLKELEKKHGFKINRNKLSKHGKEIFLNIDKNEK